MATPAQQADFGANEWLVYEIHQQYLKDPDSVSPQWREFLSDYDPQATGDGEPAANGGSAPTTAPAPRTAAPAAKAAEPQAAEPEAAEPQAAEPKAAEPQAAGQAPQAKAPEPAGKAPAPAPQAPADPDGSAPRPTALKGAAARVVQNMNASLSVPTATSVRAVPAKLLADNRTVLNNHLRRARGGKVSFTHLIGYALVRAVADVPVMNTSFTEVDGKPALVTPGSVGLGLAIDLQNPNGSRSLVVAAIREADRMDFAQFLAAYEDIVRRARQGKLTTEDFQGTTISLTNPGGIGTVHSVPRLMQGAGAIIGVGAMEYPAEFSGASDETLARLAISKTITLTSTYDHRVIQGAQSGEFLRRMHQLLLGEDGFYDEVFSSLHIPYEPVRWVPDVQTSHEGDLDKATRVMELIHAYRVRGHLMADTDPLEFKVRTHPDLDVVNHGLTLWDLDREFPVGGFAGQRVMKLRDVLGVLRDAYCRNVGIEYMHIQDPEQRSWIQQRVEKKAEQPDRELQLHVLKRLNAAEAFENFLQTKFVGQKRFSLEGGESVIPILDAALTGATAHGLDEVVIGMAHRGRLNVLANIVGKSYGQIFREFEGNLDPRTVQGSGDVKYHLGAEGTFTAADGRTTKVSLTSNPSHLEAVNPVLEGIVRAKQDIIDKGEAGFTVMPVLLHGDAAFAGQGVVAEMPADGPAARLPHRRHLPRRHQQPGRLHHRPRAVPVERLLHRRGPHRAGADLPRQRRRPGGLRPGRPARAGVPPDVQEGRRHRPGLLPPARSQRGRRPVDDPAADVRRHRRQAFGAQGLHRAARRPRGHHPRGGRGGAEGLPGAARAGVRRDPRGQRRHVGRSRRCATCSPCRR